MDYLITRFWRQKCNAVSMKRAFKLPHFIITIATHVTHKRCLSIGCRLLKHCDFHQLQYDTALSLMQAWFA